MSSPLTYVTDHREAIGFVLNRRRAGYEGFNRNQQLLGLFRTALEAAKAVSDAADTERGAG
jgi:hypothetical protein